MYLVEMIKKESLIAKPQPVRKAEEGGANHHCTRAEREKGATKEGAARESPMEAAKVMAGAKELLMRKVLLMAEGDKRPEVRVGTKELLVLEVVEMAKSLETRVAKAPLKAWLCKAPTEPTKAATKSTHTAVESSMKAAKSSYAMGPGRCGGNPQDENDKPYDDAFLHGLALLSSLSSSAAPANKKGQPLAQMALRQRLLRIHAPCRPASPPNAERHTPFSARKSRVFDPLFRSFPALGLKAAVAAETPGLTDPCSATA